MIRNSIKKTLKDEEGALYSIQSLFVLMFMMIVIMVASQYLVSWFQQKSMENTVDIAAELRAQRINNPLKEAFGLIEAMPTNQDSRVTNDPDRQFNENEDLPFGYDYANFGIDSPANQEYIEQLDQEVFELIKEDVESNSGGKITLKEGNLCIRTIALPTGMGQTVEVSCTLQGEEVVFKPYINGTDHPATKTDVFQITNVVFIGGLFDTELVFKGLGNLLPGLTGIDPVDKTRDNLVSGIAYPHLEQTTRQW